MSKQGAFLLVIRDEGLASRLSEQIQRYSIVRHVRSYREAAPLLLMNGHWSGVVLDINGFDPDPLSAAKHLREAHALVPMLILASQAGAELINGLHALRAELVMKPIGDVNLAIFIRRALVSGWLPDKRVAACVDELARTRRLTPREVQLIAYTLGTQPRQQVLRRLGVSENTIKTQVRVLLRKCGAHSLDNLAKTLLCEALVFESGPELPGTFEDKLAQFDDRCEAAE